MSMSRRKWTFSGLFVAVLIAGGVGAVLSQNDRVATHPAALLPQNSLLYVDWDGQAAHREGFEKTASYEAFYESGLMDVVNRVVRSLTESLPAEDAGRYSEVIKHVSEHGVTAGLTISTVSGPAVPYLTVVVHQGATIEPAFAEILKKASGPSVTFSTEEMRKRNVTSTVIPNSPGVEMGWWNEGEHLILTAGLGAINSSLDVVTGDAPNITTSAIYQKYAENKPVFERTAMFWLDFGLLRNTYGEFPVPMGQNQSVTVSKLLQALGLDTLGVIVSQAGYKDRANWSETFVEAPGPKRGLLALAEQEPITLADLPPIPFGTNGFSAASFDWGKAYDVIKATIHDVAALESPESVKEVDNAFSEIDRLIGFELKSQLLDTLGNVVCVYGDTRQGFLGLGTGLAVEITDKRTLLNTARKIAQEAAFQSNGDIIFRDSAKQGREVFYIEPVEAFFSIAIGFDEKWMVLGLPQTVESFFLRQDDKLTKWTPTPSYQEGLDLLPQKFTSITAVDPRKSYRAILGATPFLLGGLNGFMRQQIPN
ncbi:MAG: hypothetical protein ACKVT0_21035, partial [Planctomycetaceae bacterium]